VIIDPTEAEVRGGSKNYKEGKKEFFAFFSLFAFFASRLHSF